MTRDDFLTNIAIKKSPDSWGSDEEHQITFGLPITKAEFMQRRKELINEPDDKDAPEWAKWKAQDADGEWCWYEEIPLLCDISWDIKNMDEDWLKAPKGKIPAGHDWRDTLKEVKKETESMFKKGDKVFLNGHRNDGSDCHYGTTSVTEKWLSDKMQLTVKSSSNIAVRVSDRHGMFQFVHPSEISLWEDEEEVSWNGKGIPPVGTECEIATRDGWLKCTVVFSNDEYAIGNIHEGQNTSLKCDWARIAFRPIVTDKQRALEGISKEILESVNKNGEDFGHKEWEVAEHLYNAIADGKVKGIKLDN